jgi:Zn finger protein HypA/HybF involved in hydrogenase expression
MIIVYNKMSKKELHESAKETIPQIEEWFQKNPKRRVCKVELWFGEMISIKRKTVAEQINAKMESLIQEGRVK